MSNYRIPSADEIALAQVELDRRHSIVDAMWDPPQRGLNDAIRSEASLSAWIELAKEGRVIRVLDEVIA